jgi:hypothetical protein
LQDIYGELGASWKPKTVQRISEIKFRMDQCKTMGVPYLTAFPSKAGAAPMDAPEDFTGTINPSPPPAQGLAS